MCTPFRITNLHKIGLTPLYNVRYAIIESAGFHCYGEEGSYETFVSQNGVKQ